MLRGTQYFLKASSTSLHCHGWLSLAAPGHAGQMLPWQLALCTSGPLLPSGCNTLPHCISNPVSCLVAGLIQAKCRAHAAVVLQGTRQSSQSGWLHNLHRLMFKIFPVVTHAGPAVQGWLQPGAPVPG